MSKTAQRKRGAYAHGYTVGRYGWAHYNGMRLSPQALHAFEQGLEAGRADRPAKTFSGPLKARRVDWLVRIGFAIWFALAFVAVLS